MTGEHRTDPQGDPVQAASLYAEQAVEQPVQAFGLELYVESRAKPSANAQLLDGPHAGPAKRLVDLLVAARSSGSTRRDRRKPPNLILRPALVVQRKQFKEPLLTFRGRPGVEGGDPGLDPLDHLCMQMRATRLG